MFNSREYEWADISLIVAGRPVTGIRAVRYTKSQEKEALYAKGNRPHSIQHGNKSYAGSLTLLQSELEALELSAGGDALDANFDIMVAYGNPLKGDVIQTDFIKGAELTEIPKGMAQNDKFAEIELPFIALDIKNGYV
jgi:hypothetical protein